MKCDVGVCTKMQDDKYEKFVLLAPGGNANSWHGDGGVEPQKALSIRREDVA